MKQKITTKLANAERVADEAIQLALEQVELFQSFINSMEVLENRTLELPCTKMTLESAKAKCARLREELEP